METDLTAKFELIDEMSGKIADVAESGESLADALEDVGERAGESFDSIAENTATVATSVDGVATSFSEASKETDYWTDSIGNYNKEAMEAVYSLDELVDMGYKSADAFNEQEQAFDLCDQMAEMLNKSIEGSVEIQEELARVTEDANEVMSELNENEQVSVETKEEMQRASQNAAEAMQELTQAQQEAEAAMEAYDQVMMSGTTDLDELERAAENACMAAENMQEANQRAADATDDLAKASADAQKELDSLGSSAEDAGNKSVEMVEGLASVLAAAGITVAIKEITDSVYQMAEAFSEAESIIVDATGATGDALAGLEESMMAAYSNNYNDLSTVASAVGEINTRMGLTGDTLTETTGKFLDFSNVTGTNVTNSVANATKIMNKYNLEADQLDSVLDQLTYAGQISGASVESLSSTLITGAASFQNAGLSVENAISLLADFELAGINSSSAVMALRTAVNHFSSDGVDASTGLQEVITEIAEMEDQSEATSLAVSTFGSRAGQELALAIRNGTLSVESFNSTLEEADGTLASTAEASKTLADKWQESNNKITAAFTSVLQPTIDDMSSSLAGLVGDFGDFLNENPKVVEAITAIGVGLGVAVVAIAGTSAAAGIATTAIGAMGAALGTALAPVTAIAVALGALTTAVVLFKTNYDEAYDSSMSMTASTRSQTEELESLQAEYERSCAELGEMDEQSLTLKYQIDDLTASLAENGQSMQEFYDEIEGVIEANQQIFDTFDESSKAIQEEEVNSMALIQKLSDLASASDGAEGSQEAMEKIIEELNGNIDGLNLTYDDLINNQGSAVESARKLAQAQADQDLKTAQWEEYVDLIGQADENETELAKIKEELTAAQEEQNNALEAYNDKLEAGGPLAMLTGDEAANLDAANAKVEELSDRLEQLSETSEEATARQEELEVALGITADTTADMISEEEAAEQALSAACDSIADEVMSLKDAYDQTYEAALASFEGQFGLFDQAEANAESSVEALLNAQQSQLDYWTTYGDNISTLMQTTADDLGLTEEQYNSLMENVTSGTEEAAGLAESMVEAYESGNTEILEQTAETMEQVQEQREMVAQETAAWTETLNGDMEQAIENIQATIEDLDLSDEASAAAMSTIESYIAELIAGEADADNIGEEIKTAVTTAIDGAEEATVSGDSTMTAYDTSIANSEGQVVATATGVANSATTAMDDSEGASSSATSMMSSYASSITSQGQSAVSAARSIASQVSAELSKASGSVSISTSVSQKARGTTNSPSTFIAGEHGHELIALPAHAAGTTEGENFYMAGENGPELIVGEPGSEVFPASETDRLIASLNNEPQAVGASEAERLIAPSGNESNGGASGGSEEKHIVLEIEGGGSIEVGEGTDTDAVLDLIQDNLKPVLLSILKQEVYEEGDLSYEY